jgi:hypothetical protein
MKKTWFVDLTWPDEFYLEKVAQNMVHPIFCQNYYLSCIMEFYAISVMSQNCPK